MTIRIGVLGTADIAERRMIPAIKKIAGFEYVGVAIASNKEWGDISQDEYDKLNKINIDRANLFVSKFGGKYYPSFVSLLSDKTVDAVYIPLPPALHKKWILNAMKNNKHVIAEKPITCSYKDTIEIFDYSNRYNLNIIENYGFVYHKQINKIQELIKTNEFGKLINVDATFCFPHRSNSDFRYSKKLGGGAILDCGGYTIKAASLFLDNGIKLLDSELIITEGHEVDVYGSAKFIDSKNVTATVFFGMDNDYKCELLLNLEKGYIKSSRAFTALDNLDIDLVINRNGSEEIIKVDADDQFAKVLCHFKDVLLDNEKSYKIKEDIKLQSRLVDEILNGKLVYKK